jgi:autotransporter-associated beta strand protein
VWANGVTCCQPWNNGAVPVNDAVFGGIAGTVSVTGTINVHHINFTTTGYNFTGGTLSLQGATPTITANGGVTATIASVFAGTQGLAKGGAGTIVLAGANTYSGGTTIGAGTLQVGSRSTAGAPPPARSDVVSRLPRLTGSFSNTNSGSLCGLALMNAGSIATPTNFVAPVYRCRTISQRGQVAPTNKSSFSF